MLHTGMQRRYLHSSTTATRVYILYGWYTYLRKGVHEVEEKRYLTNSVYTHRLRSRISSR